MAKFEFKGLYLYNLDIETFYILIAVMLDY